MRKFLALLFTVCLSAALGVGVSRQQRAAAAEADPVIAAAGDIACPPPGTATARACHQAATADLLASGGYSAVLPLGDEQYNCGELSAFNAVYDPTWGKGNGRADLKSISKPVVGDNEYVGSTCSTPGAADYYTYFGDAASPQEPGCKSACKGYYSYDLGSWHVVALNSECNQTGVGGCNGTSAQGKWLKADLAAHPAQCTLAYWHRPYWKDSGGSVSLMNYFMKTLYAAGAELVLVGHSHFYERFAPMNPSSLADPNGIRQFIVGTGGRSQGALAATPPANSEARNTGTYGVLKLTLHARSYDWQFIPIQGETFTDAGSQACHPKWIRIDNRWAEMTYTGSWGIQNGLRGLTCILNDQFHFAYPQTTNSASLTFNGTRVQYKYIQSLRMGLTDIFIDNNLAATIDAKGDGTRACKRWTSPILPVGEHTITIRPNPNSTGKISLDAFKYDP